MGSFQENLKQNFLPVLAGLATVIALTCGGLFLPVKLSVLIPLTFLGLLLVSILISCLRTSALARQTDLEQALAHLLSERSRAGDNYEAFQKECTAIIRKFYLAMTVQYILAACMVCSAGAVENQAGLLFEFLGFYLFWGLFAWMKRVKEQEPEPEQTLLRDAYPAFYHVLDEVFADEGTEPIILPDYDNDVGIGRINGRTSISLGIFPAALFSEAELRQVLLHEKAHNLEFPHDPQVRALHLINDHEMPSEKHFLLHFVDYIFMPLVHLGAHMEILNAAVSEEKERRADAYVLEHGNPEIYVSALAKLEVIGLYLDHEKSYHVPYYSTPEPPEHVFEHDLIGVPIAYRNREVLWKDIIDNQLPMRFGSHPSFPQRREAMGNPSWQIHFPQLWEKLEVPGNSISAGTFASEYEEEQLRMIRELDSRLYQQNAGSYEQERIENWIKPQKILQQYRQDQAAGKQFTSLELRPVIDAAHTVMDDAMLEEVCRKCIAVAENDHGAAHAHFRLGVLLSAHYDPECLEHLYKAVETNNNYTEDGFDLIGEFCLKMHLQDDLEEYRNRRNAQLQKDFDDCEDEMAFIRKNDRLSNETVLPEDQRKANIARIREICGEHLHSLYQVHKQITEISAVTTYVVVFVEGTDENTRSNCLLQIFRYLDDLNWQYNLMEGNDLQGIRVTDLPGMVYKISENVNPERMDYRREKGIIMNKEQTIKRLTELGRLAGPNMYTYTNAKRLPGGGYGYCIMSINEGTLYITDCVGIAMDMGELLFAIPISEMKDLKHSPRITLNHYLKFTWNGEQVVLGAATAEMKAALGL